MWIPMCKTDAVCPTVVPPTPPPIVFPLGLDTAHGQVRCYFRLQMDLTCWCPKDPENGGLTSDWYTTC